jgi:hypothetical protein
MIAAIAGSAALAAACGTAATAQAARPVRHPATALAAAQVNAVRAQPMASPTATATPTTPPTPKPKPAPKPKKIVTRVPGASNCPMFPSNNVWNTDISRLPVNSRSKTWMRSMDSGRTYLHPDFGPAQGGYPYGMPYNVVTSAHPRIKVKFSYASQSSHRRYPFGSSTRIEGGKNAGGDRHAIMVNKSTCTLYELYNARYRGTHGSTAGSGAVWNLRSNKLRPAGWTSADAAGLPMLPGLLNYHQISKAVKKHKAIRHAIRVTAQTTGRSYLWPARHEAGSASSASAPPMGARFRLRKSFSIAEYCHNSQAYCKDAKAVLTEMRHYGLIVADNGSNWFYGGSAYPQWPDALVSLLKGIPAKDFQAVDESCLKVHKNSGLARAKAGCQIG